MADRPEGPRGEKRPAGVVSNAVHVIRVPTGEADDEAPDPGKSKAAQAFPVEFKVPNSETRAAMAEADRIVGERRSRSD